MKSLYTVYLALVVVILFLSWMVPVSVLVPETAPFFYIPLILVVVFVLYWIPRYYNSVTYTITSTHIMVERGVWWRRNSYVPYNRVTNIDLSQGPLSRRYGVATLAVQTAGFSGPSQGTAFGRSAEAEIRYIRNHEEVRESIMSRVLKAKPVAVEAEETPPTTEGEVLVELTEIRKLIEKIAEKLH